MNPNTERLRKKYMEHPPEGMTSEDIRRMSEDDLLDMDYFLMKMTHLMMISEKKVFIFSNRITIYFSCPNTCLSNIRSMNVCSFLLF